MAGLNALLSFYPHDGRTRYTETSQYSDLFQQSNNYSDKLVPRSSVFFVFDRTVNKKLTYYIR
jgi:hypothetical protein